MIDLVKKEKCLAVLRLRGSINVSKDLEYSFKLLHLTRSNHLTLLKGTSENLGMLHKIKDYAAWGEISEELISRLLHKRGFFIGGHEVTNEKVKEKFGYESIDKLANAIYELNIDLRRLSGLKPVFRLHPPKGGFRKIIKKPYPKGELGYHGENINDLITKMI